MQYYFAPLEGITDNIYRRLHHKYFPSVDRYYTPFFSPTVHRALTNREARELPAADTMDFTLIPQLLTKNSEDFVWMTSVCKQLGYGEVNLNIGCPSGTVTAKGKGAGMLRDLEALDHFLYEIFTGTALPISVKTRIGFDDPREFYSIMEIYNRYPIAELTVHPRVRKAFYDGAVNMDTFDYAVKESNAPLCYNGNLCTKDQITDFSGKFPEIKAVMLGRSLVGDPGMLTPGGTTADKLEGFLEELFQQYTETFGSARNAMFRLKENWRYLFRLFDPDEKLQKKLRKVTDATEYRSLTHYILHNLPLRSQLDPDW